MVFWQILSFCLGALLVGWTLVSAVRTFVLPRSVSVRLTRVVFFLVRQVFELRLVRTTDYLTRDRIMALFAPFALLSLPAAWLTLVMIGYMGMFWGLGVGTWRRAFDVSGSSLLTLGFATPRELAPSIFVLTEAMLGLFLAALLIAYLPNMYSAFSRRELAVTLIEVRAGAPPWAINMIERYYRLGRLDFLGEVWTSWEQWFAELDESHTSLPVLSYFRSPHPNRSWVTAAGAVLDGASLSMSVLDIPADPQAGLCLRAGYVALRNIARSFQLSFDPDPRPDDLISISRDEFDAVWVRLEKEGVPLVTDREQAWRSFAGWRVNYDRVLLELARLTMAPPAPWSSDRAAPAYAG